MKNSKAFLILQVFILAFGYSEVQAQNKAQISAIESGISTISKELKTMNSPCTDCLQAAQNTYILCIINAGNDQAAISACKKALTKAVDACNAGPCPGKVAGGEKMKSVNVSGDANSLFVNGNKLPELEKSVADKITNIETKLNTVDLICGFLQGYGSPYNMTVTANQSRCFTWVFSKGGKVTAMQSVWAQAGQSYNAYSSDGVTVVGVNCDCL